MRKISEAEYAKAFKAGKAAIVVGRHLKQEEEPKESPDSVMEAAREVVSAIAALKMPAVAPVVTVQPPEIEVEIPVIKQWEFKVYRDAEGLISRITAKGVV